MEEGSAVVAGGGESENEVKVYFVLGGDGSAVGGIDNGTGDGAALIGDDDDTSKDSLDDLGLLGATKLLVKSKPSMILSTPVKVKDGGEITASKDGGIGGKKSVCDSDYSTPQNPLVSATGIYNNPVKRRLDFEGICGEDNNSNSSCGSRDISLGGASADNQVLIKDPVSPDKMEELAKEEGRHHHHHKRKKKRRRGDKHSKTVVVIGGPEGPEGTLKTRQIICTTASSLQQNPGDGDSVQPQVSGGVGVGGGGGVSIGGIPGGDASNKENKSTATAAAAGVTGAPPRRIAQLVVWTKPGGGEPQGKKGKEEIIASKKQILKKAEVNKKEEVPPQPKLEKLEEETIGGGGIIEPEKNEGPVEGAGGGPTGGKGTEGDLFFVQYPARPFSDQGKGGKGGKPFRRLNSYNDPIVIKKTPPPPVPSSRRRGGPGGVGGEGKRKRGGNNTSNQHPNRKEPVIGNSGATTTVTGVTSSAPAPFQVQVQAPDQEATLVIDQNQAFQAYLQQIHQQQQDFKLDQIYHLHQQEILYNHQGLNSAGGGGGGGGGSLQQQDGLILPAEYIPTSGEPAEIVVTTSEGQSQGVSNSDPPVICFSLPPPAPPQFPPTLGLAGGGGGRTEDPPSSSSTATVFELPDRFTVSTTNGDKMDASQCGNEFDLLIQNVVHEELVNDICEEDMANYEERLRKRMRLSCGGGDQEEDEEGTVTEGGGLGGGGGGGSGPDEPGKPRCTYTELIEKALTESGGLTVSEIYNWISERYPYYRQDDDRWKNSVRHNLSINPYFKKGEKARSGAGHLWTISEESRGLRPSMVSCWEDERRKSPCDPNDLLLSMDNDTDRAVANILGMYRSKVAAAEKGLKDGGDLGGNERDLEQQEQQAPPAQVNCVDVSVSSAEAPPPPPCHHDMSSSGSTSTTATITLNELNSGQFTVDLSGITIPEGGTINFDELVSNGRLIFIETTTAPPPSDPEANKENEEQQQMLVNSADNILAELTSSSSGGGGHHPQSLQQMMADDPHHHHRGYHQGTSGYFSDSLSLQDLGGAQGQGGTLTYSSESGGGAGGSSKHEGGMTMVAPSEIMAPPPQMVASSLESHHHHQDFTLLDQVLHPLSAYEVSTSGNGGEPSGGDHHLHLNEAALYESKELGISYTFQTEQAPSSGSGGTGGGALISDHHLTHHHHSDLLQ